MNYQQRIEKVTDFIGKNLDEVLSLEQLSDISCLSKYHFHRIFTAFTGMSLQKYVRWLRLKRAAHQLIFSRDEPIINIAINAGFDSHEAFSRVFKKVCGVSPSQFRKAHDWSIWEVTPYCLPEQGEVKMNVDIKEISEIRVAAFEHRGDPNLLGDCMNKLVQWAKARNVKIVPKQAFGIAYNDPKTTDKNEFKFDLCIQVPENFKLDGEAKEKYLPAGQYATAMHKGTHDNIGDTVSSLYREWLAESGKELGDFPCIFCYHNFTHEVAETELMTECRLLLSDKN